MNHLLIFMSMLEHQTMGNINHSNNLFGLIFYALIVQNFCVQQYFYTFLLIYQGNRGWFNASGNSVKILVIYVSFSTIFLYFKYNNNQSTSMEIIALIFIFYFFVGAAICLLICVNPRDPGILGKLRTYIFQKFPDAFANFVRRVFGERVLNCLGGVKYYLAETNHPIVQYFYLLIAVGGFIGYAIKGIFKFMPNDIIGIPFVVVAYILAGICFWTYYKACKVSPGKVTKKSQKQYIDKWNQFYDGIIYKKNNKCKTCQTIKPPRSKHCSICKMCVSKFDHHCVWIRQCVGQKNYKYFVSFLFMHSIWCLYLSIIGSISLYQFLLKMKFWDRQFRVGQSVVRGTNILAIQYLFIMETLFFFLIIMCAIMGITLFIFVSYHFYLISEGQTTNERIKKNDYIDYLKKQKKNLQKFVDSYKGELPPQIIINQEKMTKKQFQEYIEDINYRLSVMQYQRGQKGLFINLKLIFSQPDN